MRRRRMGPQKSHMPLSWLLPAVPLVPVLAQTLHPPWGAATSPLQTRHWRRSAKPPSPPVARCSTSRGWYAAARHPRTVGCQGRRNPCPAAAAGGPSSEPAAKASTSAKPPSPPAPAPPAGGIAEERAVAQLAESDAEVAALFAAQVAKPTKTAPRVTMSTEAAGVPVDAPTYWVDTSENKNDRTQARAQAQAQGRLDDRVHMGGLLH